MWDIDWKSLFRNVWISEDMVDLQYLAVPFNYCKAKNENMVHNSGPYFIWYAPLFLASSTSSSVLALYPSTMHPYYSSSSRLLILIVVWMFIHCQNVLLLCFPLSIYAFQTGDSRDAPLSYFRELVYNWLIYILFISESQDSPAQFMANLQSLKEMWRKYVWQFITTRSTILRLMTYAIN